MSDVTHQKAGRTWTVASNGITVLKRPYQVILDGNNLAANGECLTFTDLPAIGSAHPNHPGLYVDNYEIEEGSGTDKKCVNVVVTYSPRTYETQTIDQATVSNQVEEWGWAGGEDERELTTAVDGTAVLNSAGDVFDAVPTIKSPAPIFRKVVKFESRQSGWGSYMCCLNSAAVTIGGISFAARTLLCMVGEQRVIGDAKWRYRYTIELRYRSNKVKLAGSSSATEIGWDVAIADAGMREKDDSGKLVLIRSRDAETGEACTVTTPELLNGSGKRVTRSGETAPTPYNLRFQAYDTATFPGWFYSEPTDAQVGSGTNANS